MEKTIKFGEDLKSTHEEKLEQLKKTLPFLFDINGNLNKEELKNFLENYSTAEPTKFEFTWAGKKKAGQLAFAKYTDGALEIDGARGTSENSQNIIIEGENLQVLHLLKNSYKEKIKCIYIDPPYNTGNDFVYKDNFELDIKQYLIESGQVDGESGEKTVDYISKDDGRKHSKWLSFIYPRLMLARDLLTEDGVIFISIDDNEQANLKLLMNEIFGEDCSTENIIWESKTKSQNTKDSYNKLQPKTEYILVYSKLNKLRFNLIQTGNKNYPEKDEKGIFRYKVIEEMNAGGIRGRETMIFPILGIYPKDGKQWQIGKELVSEHEERNDIVIRENNVFLKMRPADERNEITTPFWGFFSKEIGTAENAKQYLDELMNVKNIFDTVKPVDLIKRLIFHSTNPNDIILDFFAGSGTTGQAVMELNFEEVQKKEAEGLFKEEEKQVGGRKFILVQLPEKIDPKKEAYKAGFKYISEITIERVKRAAAKYTEIDNGFKVFKLWENPQKDEDLFALVRKTDAYILNLVALFYGYGLNYKKAKLGFANIYEITSEFEERKALVILEKEVLKTDVILKLAELGNNGQNYTLFAIDTALNIEVIHNLCNHFKKDNVIRI